MTRLLAFACVAAVAFLVPIAVAAAAPGLKIGVTDDAWLEFGPGTLEARVAGLRTLGVQVVRVTLDWREIESAQGVLNWDRDGALLDALRVAEVTPVVALWGTPAWANGGAGPNVPPRSAASFAATYVFDVEGVGQWTVAVDDGKVSVTEGAGEADCTIAASEETLVKIANGEANPTTAYMTGKLKISGDMGAALKLQKLF